jgi:hypothetical protein
MLIYIILLIKIKMEEEYNPYENLQDLTVEEIFDVVFSETPTDINSRQILPYSSQYVEDAAAFNFEILITLFMESMIDLKKLLNILCGNTGQEEEEEEEKINVYEIKQEYLEIPQPWFNSFGFYLNVQGVEVITNEFIKPTDHYCKILLRDAPSDNGWFHLKKISKPYTFLLNAQYENQEKMENIKAIFFKPKKDQNDKEYMFTISFTPITCKVNL